MTATRVTEQVKAPRARVHRHLARSAEFYARAFGWKIRKRGDGGTAFDDATGQVSGTWVTGRKPAAEPGLLFYVMVDDVAATLERIVGLGGAVVQPIGADAPEPRGTGAAG